MRFTVMLAAFGAAAGLAQPTEKWNNYKWLGMSGKECWGKLERGHIRFAQEGKRLDDCLEGMTHGDKSPNVVKQYAPASREYYIKTNKLKAKNEKWAKHESKLNGGKKHPALDDDEDEDDQEEEDDDTEVKSVRRAEPKDCMLTISRTSEISAAGDRDGGEMRISSKVETKAKAMAVDIGRFSRAARSCPKPSLLEDDGCTSILITPQHSSRTNGLFYATPPNRMRIGN